MWHKLEWNLLKKPLSGRLKLLWNLVILGRNVKFICHLRTEEGVDVTTDVTTSVKFE